MQSIRVLRAKINSHRNEITRLKESWVDMNRYSKQALPRDQRESCKRYMRNLREAIRTLRNRIKHDQHIINERTA